jgi:hypothetical protein
MSEKATKGLTALTPEIACDETAMSLPPITSAILLFGPPLQAQLFYSINLFRIKKF